MEDGAYPNLLMAFNETAWVIGLGILSGVLLAVLIFLIILDYKNLLKRIKSIQKKNPGDDNDDVIEEEIISMVKEGHEQGVLLASEAEMIHNIFEFGDKEAKDIMTHRKNMIVLDGELSYHDAVLFMIESSKSRFPVYVEDIDHIIGVLHIKDALAFSQKNELFRTPIKDIPGLIRDVSFIPETRNINTLFAKMQALKMHMAIVVDEYGQTSGIVAMEDILEEIVGNIQDEYDEEECWVEKQTDGSYLMDGMMPLEDVVELLGLPIEKDAFDTLNGLLISLMDKIPTDGEVVQIKEFGYEFDVRLVENKIIRKVKVQKLREEDDGDALEPDGYFHEKPAANM